ncbi:MAG: DUF47 domain-containing protein [Microcystaceae cyanobacterium]
MSKETPPLFGRTKFIEGQIDDFLDKISESGMCFEMGINAFINYGWGHEACADKLQKIIKLKHRSNELRRAIATELYTEMLIPDERGDVLRLLQDLYRIIDAFADNFQELLIQKPTLPGETKQDFKELVVIVVKSVETFITAARAYLREPKTVRDHIHKVGFYEAEADKIVLRLKEKIFNSDLPLENKIQLGHAVNVIDALADNAEDAGDWLSIYAIKRAL